MSQSNTHSINKLQRAINSCIRKENRDHFCQRVLYFYDRALCFCYMALLCIWLTHAGKHSMSRDHKQEHLCQRLLYFCDRALYICYIALCTGWRRCIRCLNLQVSFRERADNYMALLGKMTYKDKAPYASSPPSIWLTYGGKDWVSRNHKTILCLRSYSVFSSVCESDSESWIWLIYGGKDWGPKRTTSRTTKT